MEITKSFSELLELSCFHLLFSTGRRIGLSPIKRVVAGSSPASGSRCRGSSVVEHVFPVRLLSVVLNSRFDLNNLHFEIDEPDHALSHGLDCRQFGAFFGQTGARHGDVGECRAGH
jgi:hypothetical protein